MNQKDEDEEFMREAIRMAKQAAKEDEVPVGALIVKDGKILAGAYNQKEKEKNTLKHAEMIVIEKASKELAAWRLTGCTLYVTLEPCLMCSGALHQARVSRVVYGCKDPKGGGLGTLYSIHEDTRLNHNFPVTSGVLEDECSQALKDYFKQKRDKKK